MFEIFDGILLGFGIMLGVGMFVVGIFLMLLVWGRRLIDRTKPHHYRVDPPPITLAEIDAMVEKTLRAGEDEKPNNVVDIKDWSA